jgi:outer membrane protein assembly factor BamB
MRSCLALALCAACLAVPLFAEDWPQWRGPGRNDQSSETGLKKSFDGKAPPVAWEFKNAGVGYSGPSIHKGKVYLVGGTIETPKDEPKEKKEEPKGKGRRGGSGQKHVDEVFCLDEANGKELWRVKVGKEYEDNGSDSNWGGGPRGNPTVTEDGHLYILGIRGDVYCLKSADGSLVWTKNYEKDLGGKLMSGWGFSESPLVDGEKLVCVPGGDKGTLACLNRKTGEVIWRSTDLKDAAGYSSVVKANLAGVDQYVVLTASNVVGVSTDSGKLLWSYDCKDRYRVAVIPTPVIVGKDLVYATSGYGAGCDLIKVSGDASGQKAEKVFSNRDLANHHGGVIFKDGFIYGHGDGKGWICQDIKDGSTKWSSRGNKAPEKGSVTYADGALFCYGEDSGTLVVVEANSKEYKELGRFKITGETKLRRPSGKFWTHPVIANGKLYLRDQDLLFCYDISGK